MRVRVRTGQARPTPSMSCRELSRKARRSGPGGPHAMMSQDAMQSAHASFQPPMAMATAAKSQQHVPPLVLPHMHVRVAPCTPVPRVWQRMFKPIRQRAATQTPPNNAQPRPGAARPLGGTRSRTFSARASLFCFRRASSMEISPNSFSMIAIFFSCGHASGVHHAPGRCRSSGGRADSAKSWTGASRREDKRK